jgi:hypothetical protein
MEISSSSFGGRSASVIVGALAQHPGSSIMLTYVKLIEKLSAWAALSAALALIAFVALR